MAFVKLFSAITESSLWSESKETRLLFVTMLAKADATGFVEASLPGLARVANLTLEETLVSIDRLEGPDPYSKNPDHDGRRVIRVPTRGGWQILNYGVYRERRNEEERQAYMRQYMQEYRKGSVNSRKQLLTNVSQGKPALANAEGDEEAEVEVEVESKAERTQPPPPPPDPVFGDESPEVAKACDKRNFADWRIQIGKRIFVGQDERDEWKTLFQAEGWDSMTQGYQILAARTPEPKKLYLSMFQEIRE